MKRHQGGFNLIGSLVIVLALAAVGASGWYIWRKNNLNKKPAITNFDQCVAAGNPVAESFPEQCSANGKTFKNDRGQKESNDGFNKRVTSGQKGFSVIIPDGWSIASAQDSDFMLMMGEKQPTLKVGTAPLINTVPSFGSDGPVVFSLLLTKDDVYIPKTQPITVTFKINGGAPVTGKKYTVDYMKDDESGSGIGGRLKGDRDYYFLFNVAGNKKLAIGYSVYGSDPKNLIATIEQIIATININ